MTSGPEESCWFPPGSAQYGGLRLQAAGQKATAWSRAESVAYAQYPGGSGSGCLAGESWLLLQAVARIFSSFQLLMPFLWVVIDPRLFISPYASSWTVPH